MTKKLFCIFILFFLLLTFNIKPIIASDKINLYFFYGQGCPHCAKESAYLNNLKAQNNKIDVKAFEIYYNKDNALLLQTVGRALNIDISGVPFLIISDKHFVGFSEGITPSEIEKTIQECLSHGCSDFVDDIINKKPTSTTIVSDSSLQSAESSNKVSKIIRIPILGEVDIYKFSLPVLTIVLGVLDGFNPCAMWVLLFLISLLLGMKNRKKMFLLGSIFIIASASVYFIFMSAWLNLIIFLGFITWVRIVIGTVSFLGGLKNIKEGAFSKNSGCKIMGNDKKKQVFDKLKTAVFQHNLWLSILGIIALAFMVNLVELVCSAGLPAIYTQVLALSKLANWQYYLYIFIYVFFFMIDDLIVFSIAMLTLENTGITTKYSKYSRIIGGLIMILIGYLIIFKPNLLAL